MSSSVADKKRRPGKVARKNDTLFRQGAAALADQRWADAAATFDRAVREAPQDAVLWLNLAQARRKLGDFEAAAAAAQRSLDLKPEQPLARRLLADALTHQGKHAQAAQVLAPVLHEQADDPNVFVAAGDALVQANQYVEAVDRFMQAARRRPDFVPAHIGMGNAFDRLGMPAAAYECFRTAVTLDPDNAHLWSSLVHQAMHACLWSTLDDDLARLRAAAARGGPAMPTPFSHLSFPGATAAEHRRSAAAFARKHAAGVVPLPALQRSARREGRLRIGYLSSDFHEHATSRLIAEVIERHDRSRFEVTLYSFGVDDGSPMRRRMIGAGDHFVDLREASSRAIAERIRADGIDILVDLKGYTFGARTAVLAYRAAPLQVSWLGFPGSLGTSLIDYVVTDPVVTPPGTAGDYDEKFAYLPDCYQPNDAQREVGPQPTRASCGLPEGAFVFCCFNNTYKITPDLFDRWCRLLRQVDGAVLWLLDANLQAKENLLREAAARGVAPQRLVFAPKLPVGEHLARLALADLVLDTAPYNAHTTASDALWVGVPIVTCPGTTFASRVAASLLTTVGLTETIAASLDEYEQIALRLAGSPAGLRALKLRLEQARSASRLFDADRFAANLERLYERMFARWSAGHAPAQLDPVPVADAEFEARREAMVDASPLDVRGPRDDRVAGAAVDPAAWSRIPRVSAPLLGEPAARRGTGAPRVAVITPYYKERREWLQRCIDSVRAQDYPATHYMVADGFPQDWIDGAGVRHIRLDRAHADYGNTPRAIGGMLAASEGFDAICFLDADNWYASSHVSTCLNVAANAEHELDYVVANRYFVRDDGSVLPMRNSEDDTIGHIDTNCYFLLRGAFHTIPRWSLMPKPLAVICDRIYRVVLEHARLRKARTKDVTVNYLCTWRGPYEAAGETPPEFAKSWVDPTGYLRWWRGLTETERQVVDKLIGARLQLA
jgi:predicted O-linked N-acetylglucosamine transferase (SPINDLY family)